MNASGLIDTVRMYRHTGDGMALTFARRLAAETVIEVQPANQSLRQRRVSFGECVDEIT